MGIIVAPKRKAKGKQAIEYGPLVGGMAPGSPSCSSASSTFFLPVSAEIKTGPEKDHERQT